MQDIRNVVFLDFDGPIVLFKSPGVKARPAFADVTAIVNLNKLCKVSNAKVVVTSDWRAQISVEKLANCMGKWGFTGEVIGKTPVLGDRGLEIQTWLEAQITSPVRSFVIFDDNSKGMETFQHRFIQVDPMVGLSLENCKFAKHILAWELAA